MELYADFSDVELAGLLKSGDKAAFTEIYDRFKGQLYVFACKIVRDDDVAEDLVQEIFIYLWDKRQIINFKSSISSYLFSAVRFKFFDWVDHQKVRTDYTQAFQVFLEEAESSTDHYIEEKELSASIDREIALLPEKMREIFLLSKKENLSNKEIAAQLNISEKTVRNQISTALKILRMKLGLFAFLALLFYR